MEPDKIHSHLMRKALNQAHMMMGQTAPNPTVGAVIARDSKAIGRGHHKGAGHPHAEIEAMRSLEDPALARGADLYVTLEPCSTHGRTPPCTDAIIEAGFKRVFVGMVDPNPAHAGRGIELLRAKGIHVEVGILERQCRWLNEAWCHWIATGRPYVVAKAAFSLDGALRRPAGEGQWLTTEVARQHAHNMLRNRVDAILVGGETLRRDNPRLTIRPADGSIPARQPWRVVVSRGGELPKDAHVFTDEWKDRTLVFQEPDLDLEAVLKELGKREIQSLLVEGGAKVLTEFFRRKLVQRVQFYYAPLICGAPDAERLDLGRLGWLGGSVELPRTEITALGNGEFCVTAEVPG
jgi:diaminohydroxyphosphoribosylaminopyrimidine deaminase/5-amino-6-(5-phosphoribosylamino)uracil reductase